MRRIFSLTASILIAATLYSIPLNANGGDAKAMQKTDASPFAVSIVPAWSQSAGRGISMAANTIDTFYVVLTNQSKQGQAAFRTSNSWGYYAISFELGTKDGRAVAISRKAKGFTRNVPSTFLIQPGEQMVFPIQLDDDWRAASSLPIADEEPIDVTLKANYEVKATPESSRQKVWTGRVESTEYRFKFRHWSALKR